MTRTEYIIDDDFLDNETKMSAESQGYLWKLIRCKECKWWKAEKEECIEWYDSPYAPADGYCFRAERKENESD